MHTQLKNFPELRQIQHFEGKNGPDGIKSKSPAQDEPWHYYDPFDPDDTDLVKLITAHYEELIAALREKDMEKSAFEAAWLSHAIVDGLTPAHHYPFEEEMEDIRGEGKETRNTLKDKVIVKGESKKDTVKKNWQMYGAKGLMTTHGMFEAGVAMTLAPSKIKLGNPSEEELFQAVETGVKELFMQSARQVAMLDMYEQFYKRGWTAKLARQTRNSLAPIIVKTVTASWYCALKEAGMVSKITSS